MRPYRKKDSYQQEQDAASLEMFVSVAAGAFLVGLALIALAHYEEIFMFVMSFRR